MLLAAKTVAPSSVAFTPWRELVETACTHGAAVITAPPGALLPEALATTLRSLCGEPVWVSLGPEDRDPAVLLYSLIRAAQRLTPTVGSQTMQALARYAGFADAWPALFRSFAEELAAALPATTMLVLEHIDQVAAGATLDLLSGAMLDTLAHDHPWIAISRQPLPRTALPPATLTLPAARLRLNAADVQALADDAGCSLPNNALRRLERLLGGRADSLYSFLRLAGRLGIAPTAALIDRSAGAEQLLDRIAHTVYGSTGTADHAALDFSRRLGYTHPDLRGADLATCTPDAAWLLPLADGWQRLRDVWEAIVPRLLRPGEQASADAFRCAAATLAQQDALIPAVELYLELGAYKQAAEVINAALERMMQFGQWRTLDRWIARTPPAIREAWPWLVYAQGEIAAAQHDYPLARSSFALATDSFNRRNDAAGTCQSLLAASTVALWAGDARQATQQTLAALSHAESAGLAWHLGWATWQLVQLALADGNLAHALVYLERALQSAADADEAQLAALLGQIETLLSRQRLLDDRREQHRQAYFALEQAQQALQEHIRSFVAEPHIPAEPLASGRPWTATPLMLKLPAPGGVAPAQLARPTLWQALLRALRLSHNAPAPPDATTELPIPPDGPTNLFSFADDLGAPLLAAVPGAPRTTTEPEPAAHPEPEPAPALHLIAQHLGPFRVSLNDDPILHWPSGRGRALLKYIIMHHDRPIPRDVLMDLFWPEALPDDARNNLNVAMHGLRQAFRNRTDQPIVLFQREDATYRLNPELTIWLDVTEFEHHVDNGRQHERDGIFATAVASYEQAASLYQGDFLADDPYEDWPMLRREQLRLAYLDMLERLGQIYFSQGQYGACAALCQRILARDNCREDAHCRLMRCYSRQGQPHLALRQYQACVKALNDELGVEPLPATVRLADEIRRQEYV
jgi:DNA-binding SARP family transcriptional activator